MLDEEAEPLVDGDGTAAVHVKDLADVVEEVLAGGELVDVVVEGDLLRVVELDAAVAVTVVVLEPLVQETHLSVVGYCVIEGAGEGGREEIMNVIVSLYSSYI